MCSSCGKERSKMPQCSIMHGYALVKSGMVAEMLTKPAKIESFADRSSLDETLDLALERHFIIHVVARK